MPIIPIRLYNITSPHLTLFYVEHAMRMELQHPFSMLVAGSSIRLSLLKNLVKWVHDIINLSDLMILLCQTQVNMENIKSELLFFRI